MPQMSPMMWLILMMIFMIFIFFIMTQMYFLFKYISVMNLSKKKNIEKMNLEW